MSTGDSPLERDGEAPGSKGDLVVSGVAKSFVGYERVLDGVDLSVPAGHSVALLGPSGCGKTTLLRVIAGLEHPDAGSVALGDQTLVDAMISVPPEKRQIGMVFQDWALFTHLNVARNVGFGLPRAQRKASPRIDESLALVGMESFGDREISTLSGGQQQRVALARALAPRPDVLLLDEPFSNLDATLRASVRSELRTLLIRLGMTSIFVTHDQEEAFILGDLIAVMDQGRVIQFAPAVDIYERPATRWVAEFVGEANFVPATVDATGDGASTDFGSIRLGTHPDGLAAGSAVEVMARPEHFELERLTVNNIEPGGTEPGGMAGKVDAFEYLGHSTRYRVEWIGGIVTVRDPHAPRFNPGDQVQVTLRDGAYHTFGVD